MEKTAQSKISALTSLITTTVLACDKLHEVDRKGTSIDVRVGTNPETKKPCAVFVHTVSPSVKVTFYLNTDSAHIECEWSRFAGRKYTALDTISLIEKAYDVCAEWHGEVVNSGYIEELSAFCPPITRDYKTYLAAAVRKAKKDLSPLR